jgi:ABC-type lipoprotein export system ATPase subunit
MPIEILLTEALLSLGVASYIDWQPDKAPHCVIVGASGTGKTYLFKSIAGKCALLYPDSQLYFGDFKGDPDFNFLAGAERFARFDRCIGLLNQFYNRLLARQSGKDETTNPAFLFLDEYAAMCNSLVNTDLIGSRNMV